MISEEPVISIGILKGKEEIRGAFIGMYQLQNSIRMEGSFIVRWDRTMLVLADKEGNEVLRGQEIHCTPIHQAIFSLSEVAIGIDFHWERKERQMFEGSLVFLSGADGTITAINRIGVESYLKSVISSEMSAQAPLELLKAHAITSRSWLAAMLERQKIFKNGFGPSQRSQEIEGGVLRWYDREDHENFDVCADDHCQRYQGISKVISKDAEEAVSLTSGHFLLYDNEICDARFSKACGGRTELFEHTWEDTPMPYLQSISDSPVTYRPILNESDAEHWITSSPDAYCNTSDGNILHHVLPSFDQETTDFFRWKVEYTRQQLEQLLTHKSGIDFGTLMDIIPIRRGPSGRIYELKIVGGSKTMIIGKELEIRRWLSISHLYSSAFLVKTFRDERGVPIKFSFVGAGWGHGVGLCQIGAAVMATQGCTSERILQHYFRNVELKKLY